MGFASYLRLIRTSDCFAGLATASKLDDIELDVLRLARND